MAQSDTILLNAFPYAIVRLACRNCGRRGQYRKGNLIVAHGAAIPLPDLLANVAKCERAGKYTNGCGAYYVDLAPKD